ncbi:MAG: hypothetical protein LAQ30_31330 [Acidobacteriia bacterium]|nr:hypothetical protein [Terriglobia bacterium]
MRGPGPIVFGFLLTAASLAAPGHPDVSAVPVLRQYLDHAGFNWKSKQVAHFHIFFEADSEAGRRIRELRRNLEKDRARVLMLIGEKDYEPTIYAFFLKSGEDMQELLGVNVDGRSRPVQHAVFSVVTPERLHLTHELCHEIVSNLWGAAEPWIEEGLATYADEGDNTYYDSWALLKANDLIPLERLVDPGWTSSMDSPDVTYTELGGFLKFLYDRYGMERVKAAWQGGSQSIPRVFGKPLDELEREWHASLLAQFPKPPIRHYRSAANGFRME